MASSGHIQPSTMLKASYWFVNLVVFTTFIVCLYAAAFPLDVGHHPDNKWMLLAWSGVLLAWLNFFRINERIGRKIVPLGIVSAIVVAVLLNFQLAKTQSAFVAIPITMWTLLAMTFGAFKYKEKLS